MWLEAPTACVIYKKKISLTCSQCLCESWAVMPCPRCQQLFCGECHAYMQDKFHEIECGLVGPEATQYSTDWQLALRLLLTELRSEISKELVQPESSSTPSLHSSPVLTSTEWSTVWTLEPCTDMTTATRNASQLAGKLLERYRSLDLDITKLKRRLSTRRE